LVPVATAFSNLNPDDIRSAADSAVKKLLSTNSDLLALATYLWAADDQDVPLVNRAGLMEWGRSWSTAVLLNGATGKRVDEHLTTAALAASVVYGDRHSDGDYANLSKAVGALTLMPMSNPAYESIVLYSATRLGVANRDQAAAAENAVRHFIGPQRSRLFGLGFACRALKLMGSTQTLKMLAPSILARIGDRALDYEDQLYLADALFAVVADEPLMKDHLPILRRAINCSPISTRDEDSEPVISDLYRSVLLPLAYAVQAREHDVRDELLDTKYKGRRFTGALAFVGVVSILALSWHWTVTTLAPVGDAGIRYWIFKDFSTLTAEAALLFIALIFSSVLLAGLSLAFVWTSFGMLVVSAVESDRRFGEVIWHRSVNVVKFWLGLVVLAIVTNLVANFIGPAVGNLLGVP
jgi:hypothetical protein